MNIELFHSNTRYNIYHYFLAPLLSGLYGFTIFFMTLLGAKSLGALLGTIPQFNIEFVDAEMSILGFVFLFIIRLLKNYIPKDQMKEGYK